MENRFYLQVLLGTVLLFFCSTLCMAAVPHFLSLPSNDPEIKIQQGWIYTFGDQSSCGHQGIDYIKGTVDQSNTWQAFEVVPAADGEAVLRTSPSYGDYVTVKTVVDGTTYYTLYAHLDNTKRKLQLGVPTTVTRGVTVIGIAGKTGTASGGVLHLHFELSKIHFGRPASDQEIKDCQAVNGCGTCRLDPYGIYGARKQYPTSATSACSTSEYYWVECPPRTSATACSNGTSTGFPPSGRPPVHPNGTIVKVASSDAAYVLQDGRRMLIPDRRTLNNLYGVGHGFDFRDIVTISDDEMKRYQRGADVTPPLLYNGRSEPDGRLIKPKSGTHVGEVSIVSNNGRRRPFGTLSAFQGLGYKDCNITPLDVADYESYPVGPPVEVMIVASSSLLVTPPGPYTTGQTLNAQFRLMNIGTFSTTLNTVTAGGRLNGDNSGAGGFPDFTMRSSVRLDPGQSYDYSGTLPLNRAGNYNFFIAYKDTDGNWSTSVPTEPGVTNERGVNVSAIIVTSGGTDFFAPNLNIISYSDGQTVDTSSITLSGTASDANSGNSGITIVKVNGQRASADTASGSETANWIATVPLNQGANTLTVETVDGSINQNATKKVITINCQPLRAFTIRGRLTDANGNAVANTDVVYGGARIYPDGNVRIMRLDDVFTDSNGNYLITAGFEGFTITVTPDKQGFYFIPRFRQFQGMDGDKVSADFVAKPSPPAPTILTEKDTDHAINLTSITQMRDPVSLSSADNLNQQDLRTRVVIFATGIALSSGEVLQKNDVQVQGENVQGTNTVLYLPEVEYVGQVPNQDGLTQIVIKFTDDPKLVGDVWVRINFLGSFSNKARIIIKSQ